MPRLEIDLAKIHHNAKTLVDRLKARGIAVTGVTKAVLGAPEVAKTLLKAGVRALGDSRIENIETLRRAGITAPLALIRSPMISQADRVVAAADMSFNTELDTIAKLSAAAQAAHRSHGIVLMVELGDLREGIMPGDLADTVQQMLRFPNIVLQGIGTNLACRSGVIPDTKNMSELSALANAIGATIGAVIGLVSGGNSANLRWAESGADTGRINDLRLGESLLLGRETLDRRAIDGLYTDAITLIAEVIESKAKPTQPTGAIAQTAFGPMPAAENRGAIQQTILAIGHQDTDPDGLTPPPRIAVIGASSDHLIVDSRDGPLAIGAEIAFQLNYSALLRAMTSPFVAKVYLESDAVAEAQSPLLASLNT